MERMPRKFGGLTIEPGVWGWKPLPNPTLPLGVSLYPARSSKRDSFLETRFLPS